MNTNESSQHTASALLEIKASDLAHYPLSRRTLMMGSLAATVNLLSSCEWASDNINSPALKSVLPFKEVPVSAEDTLVVPEGYHAQILAPWGTPLLPGAPPFLEDATNTAADQALQVGFNHDGMHYFGWPQHENNRGLLVINHEYTDANMLYSAAQGTLIEPNAEGREKVAKALAAHGVSIIAIEKNAQGEWVIMTDDKHHRRITGETPVEFSGPVTLQHALMQTSLNVAKGTLANCANGYTPWGTYLTCEENWPFYFGTQQPDWQPNELQTRYGVAATGGYGWCHAEPRFDLAINANELNHFGWVVEIDPFNPQSTPIKRSALGRIKHESATCTQKNGHIVVYMGDDENGEYIYKFVGDKPWSFYRDQHLSPLDFGTLYVARFLDDGRGEWLPLIMGEGPFTLAQGWLNQADILVRTRLAADALKPTKLHRPEWIAVHPDTQAVYVTLTNGSGHASAVNAHRNDNGYGHIIRFNEAPNSDRQFNWEIFLLAGDPSLDHQIPAEQTLFGSPDGIMIDPSGLVWIQTDISNSAQHMASKGYQNIGNSAMLVADPNTREIKRFLTGPRGCEITGLSMTPDQKTLFVNIQHPGESSVFWNAKSTPPSPQNPTSVSRWPYGQRPRSATVIIQKQDGGKVGQA